MLKSNGDVLLCQLLTFCQYECLASDTSLAMKDLERVQHPSASNSKNLEKKIGAS